MNGNHHATLYRVPSVVAFSPWGNSSSDCEVHDQYCERFGINEARDLIQKAHTRPELTKQKLLLVRTDFVTHEAQNALLKILEEPPLSTKFIFVVPTDLSLLETLRSRFHEPVFEDSNLSEQTACFKDFNAASYKDRLQTIDLVTKARDVKWMQLWKQGFIHYLKQVPIEDSVLHREGEFVVRHLLTRGASNKMLLEHIALHLPVR